HRLPPQSSSLLLSPPSPPRTLPSFPTRRSSDLDQWHSLTSFLEIRPDLEDGLQEIDGFSQLIVLFWMHRLQEDHELGEAVDLLRSEEHTSELQSRFDLVCRLLLEKKNIKSSETH